MIGAFGLVDSNDNIRIDCAHMLHDAGNAEGKVYFGSYALAGLADLVGFRLPAKFADRAAASNASAKKFRELIEPVPFFLAVETASAGHDDLCRFNRMFILLALKDFLKDGSDVRLFKFHFDMDSFALSGSIGSWRAENARAYRADLRT